MSYHGGDTTGADWFRISPKFGVTPSRMAERRCEHRPPSWPCGPGRADVPLAHGAAAATRAGFVTTTGKNDLLELNRDGHRIGRLRVRDNDSHLMDFAIDDQGRHLYVSACATRATIQRFELERGRRATTPSGTFCGRPLAIYRNRFLFLAAVRVDKSGYPRTTTEELRLLDLEEPGAGRRLPHSSIPLDAVVVRLPR